MKLCHVLYYSRHYDCDYSCSNLNCSKNTFSENVSCVWMLEDEFTLQILWNIYILKGNDIFSLKLVLVRQSKSAFRRSIVSSSLSQPLKMSFVVPLSNDQDVFKDGYRYIHSSGEAIFNNIQSASQLPEVVRTGYGPNGEY